MIPQAIAVILSTSVLAAPARAADILGSILWKQRAVVVLAAGADDALFARQLDSLRARHRLLDDCDTRLIAVARDDAALRGKLGLPLHGFAVALVGKDGGVKESWREPVDPARIFALIDRMPMRRDEVRARR